MAIKVAEYAWELNIPFRAVRCHHCERNARTMMEGNLAIFSLAGLLGEIAYAYHLK
jgi:hypothetical protein